MHTLACDLGGTRSKLGIVRAGRVLAQSVVPARADQDLGPQLSMFKNIWLELLGSLGLGLKDCVGIGVSFPSVIDHRRGRVMDVYGKYADAPNLDLRAWARAEMGLPLAIENDARMAAIGEWRYGVGQGIDNLVMMTLGTGLGVCAIIEGKILRGGHGQAGIMGAHLSVCSEGGRSCVCGNVGCAEAEASTASLGDLARHRTDFTTSPLAVEPVLDYEAVFRHATAGDPCACGLRDHSLRIWSTLTVSLIHAYDPDRVIMGGGIMASKDIILPAVREHVRRHSHTPWGQVSIEASALGDHAALVAAEWLLDDQAPYLNS